MKENMVLKEIGRKLTAEGGGNCEYDSNCAYGSGKDCSADNETLLQRLAQVEREAKAELKLPGMVCGGNPKAKPWPCLSVLTINFSEPERNT